MSLDPAAALLTGRVALVTGAAQGIGQAAAVALASFGADVAICDRDVVGLDSTTDAITAAGRSVVAGELDVRDTEAVANFVETVVGELGRLDILVNNAGGGFGAAFLDVSAKGQDALVAENFTSVTNFVRACEPRMSVDGSIVNVTSIEAHRAGPGFAVYSAMKAAVANLTKSLALELAPLRVNCVAPDVILTPGVGDLSGAQPPLGAPGVADDVAGPIVFLAGPMARFITGTTLHVDGGNHAAGGWHRTDDGYTT